MSGYNFYIGDLGFNKMVNRGRIGYYRQYNTYSRQTAPFKRDQIDSSGQPGDNSLTGWWARGQFSFHMGQGIEFYDIGNGDVLNTCYDSSGADLFSTPGRVGVEPNLSSWLKSGQLQSGESVSAVFGNVVMVRTSGQVTGRLCSASYDIPGLVTLTNLSLATSGYYPVSLFQGGKYLWVYATDGGTGHEIERIDPATNAATAVFTLSGTYVDLIAYAKDRLWILDGKGNLYTESEVPSGTLPVSVGSTPVVTITGGKTEVYASPAFAAGPTGVYLSRAGEDIYYVSLSSDGSVPTLAAPVVVASMPRGEAVCGMIEALGMLVIVTKFGVRVAEINSDGGLVYGPLMVQGWPWGTYRPNPCMSSWGTAVQFCATDVNGYAALWEIDLQNPSPGNSLVFPYRCILSTGQSLAVYNGISNGSPGQRKFWNGATVYSDYNYQSWGEASVTTGYHRMGTLDPKFFYSVDVKTSGGPQGSIQVYRVDADGTETSLGSFTVDQQVATFDLGMTEAVERIALKFVIPSLAKATGVTELPSLLGYQLRALPAPKRQRLIQVPLQMYDSETNSQGRQMGSPKSAWARLSALEAYEDSNSVVTFTDKDTGETGTAFIESIELDSVAPSTARDPGNGFGGVVLVTLRKL